LVHLGVYVAYYGAWVPVVEKGEVCLEVDREVEDVEDEY
jgi:hypothetical protein